MPIGVSGGTHQMIRQKNLAKLQPLAVRTPQAMPSSTLRRAIPGGQLGCYRFFRQADILLRGFRGRPSGEVHSTGASPLLRSKRASSYPEPQVELRGVRLLDARRERN